MAGSARYTVILDACVLYPAPLRDVLLSLASAIVTFNLRDFPAEVMDAVQVEIQHPDDFLLNQLDLAPFPALKAIKAMRARLRRPPIDAAELVTMLERLQLPLSAARLREVSELI